MPRFHHVNLGVPPDVVDAEVAFLVDVLGYRHVDPGAQLSGRGARWYEADDGSQVHLSVDPDHRPAARAHVAIECGAELADVAEHLRGTTLEHKRFEQAGSLSMVTCRDPAGNLWELRGALVPS